MQVNQVQSATTSRVKKAATPFLEGRGYAMRKHYKRHDIYVSGHKTAAKADKAMRDKMSAIDKNARSAGAGADRTTLAQAMQDYALARLPFLKGAVQEARRMNHYLRAAGLDTLALTECPQESPAVASQGAEAKKKRKRGVYFKVTLQAHTLERKIANGLHTHRKAQLNANADTNKFRAVLATTVMSAITRDMLQKFMNIMSLEGNAPATVELERSMLRVLFNYSFRTWRWTELFDNPATGLTMPEVDNMRQRTMSLQEQQALDLALTTCRDKLVAPTTTLLRETAMRSSEPLKHVTWGDVDWERKVLHLKDAKAGSRDVPLSPVAIQVLRDLGLGPAGEKIIKITYEALRASWQRACKRAGVEDLVLHDLRRTGATRMALKTGNAFLVQALTGHKTLSMVERYVQVGADDAVKALHAPDPEPASQPGAQAPRDLDTPAQERSPTYTHEQLQELVQMAVQATLSAVQTPPPQPAQRQGMQLRVVR